MPNSTKDNFLFFQDQLVWWAIMAYIALFVIKSDWGKENLDTWQLTAKQIDASAMIFLGILTGKKGFDFLKDKLNKKVDEHNPVGPE